MAEHQHTKVAAESYCPDCGTELGRTEFERQHGPGVESEHGAIAANVLANGSIAPSGRQEINVDHMQHDHPRVEVRGYCPDCGEEFDRKAFDRSELGEAGLALHVRADGSLGYANADQAAPARQRTE
ncbi:MAG: hypothetical protein AUH85_07035 [Chloroflexi bacterium 13_1_40CM_4_68_4]|nr:MAG: hypothetical protein AUH85_07035 [Chloroflexi bacterium 13_1_40CM_4_68_4]